jgi:hypothetical protein
LRDPPAVKVKPNLQEIIDKVAPRMTFFSIPSELRDIVVSSSTLSVRAKNCLVSNGIRKFGDLHGRAIGEVASFRQIGAITLTEIVSAIPLLGDSLPCVGDDTYRVSEALNNVAVEVVFTSTRALNRLKALNIHTLGQLAGVSRQVLVTGPGIGAGTVTEIDQALSHVGITMTAPSADGSGNDVAGQPLSRSVQSFLDDRVFRVPESVKQWPIHALGLSENKAGELQKLGIDSWGDLEGRPHTLLLAAANLGRGHIDRILAILELAAQVPFNSILRSGEQGALPPLGPPELFAAVASAITADDELEACLVGLSSAHARIVRQRWRRPGGKQIRLDEIALETGLTRQRAQQISRKRDELLLRSNIYLPQCARLAELVVDSRYGLSEEELFARSREVGVIATQETTESIESLSKLGLVPAVHYDRRLRAFVPIGIQHVGPDLVGFRRSARRQLKDIGCIEVGRLPATSIPVTRAIAQAFRNSLTFAVLEGYLVPDSDLPNRMMRYIHKMARVAGGIESAEAYAGLSKLRLRKLADGTRVLLPPQKIVEEMIRRDDALEVVGDIITLRDEDSDVGRFSEPEQLLLDVMNRSGGVATLSEIRHAFVQAGYSLALVGNQLGKPFIVKRGPSLWGIRGVLPHRDTYAAKLSEARTTHIKEIERSGNSFKIVYELTPSALKGAVALPPDWDRNLPSQWTARATCGEEFHLTTERHVLSPLNPWLTNERAIVGNTLIATFDPAIAVVDLQLVQ